MTLVVLTEAIHEAGMAVLRARPDVRVVLAGPGDPRFTGADALGVRTRTLDAAALSLAPRLRVVAKHGVGTDNIDVAHLSARGVPVAITAEANAGAVAEHALMLMLAVSRRLAEYDAATRRGDWAVRAAPVARELEGRTVLVVGYGRIGSRVGRLCRAFGMRVLAHDPAVPDPDGAEPASDLDAALPEADLVTLHLPRTAETLGLLGAARLARMRPGAILINCARGGIVDEPALAAALAAGHLGGAGLDVFAAEPPDTGNALFALRNVVLTPHSAALTREGTPRMAEAMARNLLAGIDGALDRGSVVNPEVLA